MYAHSSTRLLTLRECARGCFALIAQQQQLKIETTCVDRTRKYYIGKVRIKLTNTNSEK